MLDAMSNARTAVAVQLPELPDADGFPTLSSWEVSGPLRFSADWHGNDADPEREPEVRLLWKPEWLFVRFRASFRVITVFPTVAPSARRAQLCARDGCPV